MLHFCILHKYHRIINTSVWRIAALTEESIEEMIYPLWNIGPKIKLTQKNGSLLIDDRRVVLETDYASIAKSFLGDIKQYKKIDIIFVTPTSFKVNQAYAIFPDIEKIMRSFLKKWNAFSSSDVYDDEELFQTMCDNMYVAEYRMRLQKFYLEKTKIPGFQGSYTLICKRYMILSNLAAMLCYFGSIAGCGIKVALGMGAMQVELEESE